MGGAVTQIAVVLVDIQRDFLDPTARPGVGSWEKAFCVPGVERLVRHAREQGWKVVHVGTKHQSAETLPSHHRRRGIDVYCAEGSDGWEFVIPPEPNEEVVFKTWYSAFEPALSESLGEVPTIIWGGVATDCCIQQSAFDADRRGIHSLVPIEAVSASSVEAFAVSLSALAKSAATIVDLASLVDRDEVPEGGLDPQAVDQRSRAWFVEQQSRLGHTEGASLEDVLARLRPA
jgi:nicotinamidase-related amidase